MVSTKALGSDIEYSLRSNALSAKSVLGGRVALTIAKYQKEIDKLNLKSPETGRKDCGVDWESEAVKEAMRAVAESSLADCEEGGATLVVRT